MRSPDRRRHDRALELAATGLDFALAGTDATELEAHLETCPACTRSATALRADSRALRLPATLRPSRRVDDAVGAVIAGRSVRTSPRSLLLVAATILLLAALLGVAAVGAYLLQSRPNLPLVVTPTLPAVVVDVSPSALPSPSALAIVDATPSSSPAPSAAPTPNGTPALPTGTLIAYVGRVGERSVIHTVQPDGQLDQALAEGGLPVWSPDGRSIAFECRSAAAAAAGRIGDICVMDLDGANTRVIVTGGISPMWSPDGTRILFSRSAIDAGDTWIADADGSNARKVGAGGGSWSPDGSWLMLLGASGAAPDATIVRPDGSGARQLGDCWNATWSPDGGRIACTRWDEVHGTLGAVTVADGSTTTLLEADVAISDPVWVSPDQLAITMVRSGSPAGALPPATDLYLLDLTSGKVRQLTSGVSVAGPISVSPNGTWLAFTVVDGDTTEIYLASIAGEVRRLATSGTSSRPQWQPRPRTPSASPVPSAAPTPSGTPAPAWQSARIPPMFAGGNATPVAVTAGGNGFAAVGGRAFRDLATPSGGTASAWRSTDGLTWEPATATADLAVGDVSMVGFPDVGPRDVAWGPPGFVAVGTVQDGSTIVGRAWVSQDGQTWTRSDLPSATLARPAAVTWSGEAYVMVGVVEATSAPRAAVWLSADGRSWRRAPDAPAFEIGSYIDTGEYHAWGGPADVTAGADGTVYAVGTTCAAGTTTGGTMPDCRPVVWRSSDGTAWLRVPGPGAAGVSPVSVAASGAGVVAVAHPRWDPAGPPSILVIGDAKWQLDQPSGLPPFVHVVAYGQGYLALSTAANEISLWTSPDGVNWAPVAGVPQPPDVTSLRDVDLAVAGNRAVIVGWTEVDSTLGLDSFAILWTPR